MNMARTPPNMTPALCTGLHIYMTGLTNTQRPNSTSNAHRVTLSYPYRKYGGPFRIATEMRKAASPQFPGLKRSTHERVASTGVPISTETCRLHS